MPSSIDKEIADVFRKWGKATALEFKEETAAALVRGGRKNPNTVSLEFNEHIVYDGSDITLEIRAENNNQPAKYWRIIEQGWGIQANPIGKGASAKQPPADVFGKRWQNEQGIDARVVLLQIKARKKKGLNTVDRKFRKLKKTLDYAKAVKAFSFIVAKSIKKKGIKPKPFLGKVLNDQRITELRTMITPLLGQKYKLIIKGLE